MAELAKTPRTQVRRLPKRAAYDRATADAILDEGLICHVGLVEDSQPFVIPTGYARDGDRLLLHGSAASRMMRAMAAGADLCITVTLLDGLVMARSAFHHSMNYRSVVILGRGRLIEDPAAKSEAMRRFTEHVVPGRWAEIRWPSPQELKATLVVEVPLEEGSVKIRTGPPIDDAEDLDLPVWAGVLPLRQTAGGLVPDDANRAAPPAYLTSYRRGR